MKPAHPYTKGLFQSIADSDGKSTRVCKSIPGHGT